MDLCISVPQNAPEGVVYSLPADFTAEGEKRGGCLCATREKLLIYENGELAREYLISDFTEFKVTRGAGSSMAQGIDKSGQTLAFCGFTQEKFLRFAEMMKLLDHYVRTGELITDTGGEEGVHLLRWQEPHAAAADKARSPVQENFHDSRHLRGAFGSDLGHHTLHQQTDNRPLRHPAL